jgi:hypothetical protein
MKNGNYTIYFCIAIGFILFSCASKNENKEDLPEGKTENSPAIKTFIYGLWSRDTNNLLSNEGYMFRPDGTVELVCNEYSGNWEFNGKDSIVLKFGNYQDATVESLNIDSLSESRMVLSGANGRRVFRKVPFGINDEGVVLNGFAGDVSPGKMRDYNVTLPFAKKIQILLKSENEGLRFSFSDTNGNIISSDVREWTGILITGGKYKVTVMPPETAREIISFDLKVLTF